MSSKVLNMSSKSLKDVEQGRSRSEMSLSADGEVPASMNQEHELSSSTPSDGTEDGKLLSHDPLVDNHLTTSSEAISSSSQQETRQPTRMVMGLHDTKFGGNERIEEMIARQDATRNGLPPRANLLTTPIKPSRPLRHDNKQQVLQEMDTVQTAANERQESASPSPQQQQQSLPPGAYAASGSAIEERPVWDQHPQPSSEEEHPSQQQQQEADDETLPRHTRSGGSSRLLGGYTLGHFFRTRSLVEASPIEAETVVYASNVVVDEEAQKRKTRQLRFTVIGLLLVLVVVGIVVGVVVGDGQNQSQQQELTFCESTPREEMKARHECECFGQLEDRGDAWNAIWNIVKFESERLNNLNLTDLNSTDCSRIQNVAFHTMMEVALRRGHEDEDPQLGDIAANLDVVLKDGYYATIFYLLFHGDDWYRNDKWFTIDTPACGWYGLECTLSGRVIGFNMRGNNLGGNMSEAELALPHNPLIGTLDLGNNPGLYGSVPSNLFLRLKQLDLRNNFRLTGPLPAFYESEVLDDLNLFNTSFTGTIPSEVGTRLPRLRSLRLDYNDLTGTVPSELTNVTSLEYLSLRSNQLEGTLPDASWGQLSFLESLNLGSNAALSGTMPDSFNQMLSLSFLDVSFTNLTGRVPVALADCTLPYLDTILVDCQMMDDVGTCGTAGCCRCAENFTKYDEIRFH